MENNDSKFVLLTDRNILDILDGDKVYDSYNFGDGSSTSVSMPYLGGRDICDLSTQLGFPRIYNPSTDGLSRWEYLKETIEICIKNNACSNLLAYIFSLKSFYKKLKDHDPDEVQTAHIQITSKIINKINGILIFSNCKLIMNGSEFTIVDKSEAAEDYPSIRKLEKGLTILSAFNSYIMVNQIGQGGNGKVWLCTDKNNEQVALKFIERSNRDHVLKRFKNETFFCIKHQHKNIVPILDYGTLGNTYIFYVMPLYDCTLRDKIKNGIDANDAIDIFTGLIAGLKFAHSLKTIHRDIKPENILFAKNSSTPVIADFGIAHFSDNDLETVVETKKGERLANFQYAAPEQRSKNGNISPQTDIYAASLILNEMFTKEIPQANGYKKIGSINPKYSYLDDLVSKMFKQNPNDRLYPEDRILTELSSLAKQYDDAIAIQKLSAHIESINTPEEISPSISSTKYENKKLIFTFDQDLPQTWFHTISQDSYGHTEVVGYETYKLQHLTPNQIAMPISGQESNDTIKSIVGYVSNWVHIVNKIYNDKLKEVAKSKQELKEQERIAQIKKLQKETDLNRLLSSLSF